MTTLFPRRLVTATLGALALLSTSLAPAVAAPALSPTTSDKTSAADRYHWGTPLPGSDEFNYTGLPDSNKWFPYGIDGNYGGDGSNCWPGHAGNGRRCVDQNYVNGSFLRQTGLPNGDTAGLGSTTNLKYGRYEVRARVTTPAGAEGYPYHPVLLLWPSNDDWPAGAEYDFFEVNVGDTCATAFLHYPNHEPKRQEEAHKCPLDLTQWHNYGFEWTPDGLTGFIDGKRWYHFDSNGIQNAPGPMRLTIQLDNFYGDSGMQTAYFDIDWARMYAVPTA